MGGDKKDRDKDRERRDRDREKSGRKSKFQSPPREEVNDAGSETGSRFTSAPQIGNPEYGGPIIPSAYDLPSRKIYVGGIGPYHTETEVSQYLGNMLQKAGVCLDVGNPIIRTQINRDKRYMFVELRTAEEAAALMQLDGLDYQNYPLRIRRCQEYDASTAPPLKRPVPKIDTVELGIVSTQVQDTPNKVFIGGIPRDWDEEKIKQLLVS